MKQEYYVKCIGFSDKKIDYILKKLYKKGYYWNRLRQPSSISEIRYTNCDVDFLFIDLNGFIFYRPKNALQGIKFSNRIELKFTKLKDRLK